MSTALFWSSSLYSTLKEQSTRTVKPSYSVVFLSISDAPFLLKRRYRFRSGSGSPVRKYLMGLRIPGFPAALSLSYPAPFFFGILIAAMGRAPPLRNNYTRHRKPRTHVRTSVRTLYEYKKFCAHTIHAHDIYSTHARAHAYTLTATPTRAFVYTPMRNYVAFERSFSRVANPLPPEECAFLVCARSPSGHDGITRATPP